VLNGNKKKKFFFFASKKKSSLLNRNYIVQTEEQYIFIYEAINEAIQSGQTEVLARNLLTHLQRLLQPINDSSLTEMELEFKVKTPKIFFLKKKKFFIYLFSV